MGDSPGDPTGWQARMGKSKGAAVASDGGGSEGTIPGDASATAGVTTVVRSVWSSAGGVAGGRPFTHMRTQLDSGKVVGNLQDYQRAQASSGTGQGWG